MKRIPVYKFYKHKYGDELLVDVISYEKMMLLQRVPMVDAEQVEAVQRSLTDIPVSRYVDDFVQLVSDHFREEHGTEFYADRLCITPNHLSAVVRQQSGMSVMDWINRTTIMEAKILLKHSTLMMYEIADRLCFPEPTAFNRYFKKQTGMTPLEYRESQ